MLSGCIGNENPSASFSIEPSSIKVGIPVYLNSTSYDNDGSITNYSWKINDIIVGFNQQIQYQFEENGSYTITLFVTDDGGGSDTYERSIFIGDLEAIKEKFIGEWHFDDGQQTGQWIFYQNNSMKSTFSGQYGASITHWWHFELNNSEICYTQPSASVLESACYQYEFLDDYSTVIFTFDGETATWYKAQ
jgi:PKD repeat protein